MNNKVINANDILNDPNATAVSTDFRDRSDPEYTGPGAWSVIHVLAYNARNKEKQQQFMASMREICGKFPCINCRYHCGEYIRNHPMEDYLDLNMNGEKLGLFVWSWKFHNCVNARLKKPIMSWDTAYNMYLEEDVENNTCSTSCSKSK